ncbi:hypothetical protein V2J09_023806 [Rumex salicifolius]
MNSSSATTTASSAAATTAAVVSSTNINPIVAQFPMSDQIQAQAQTQTQPQLLSHQDPLVQPQPYLKPEIEDSVSSINVSSDDITASTTSIELPNALSQNPSPSTKLVPLRPRKIRKLSSDTSTAIVDGDLGVSDFPATGSKDATALTPSPMPIVPAFSDSKPSSASKTAKKKMVAVAGTGQSRVVHHPPRMMARSLSFPGEIERALQHLQSVDPHLAQLITLHQPPTFDSFQTPFLALSKSILYQQLAYKAGTSIYARFVALCGGEEGVLPDTVLALTPQQLRQIGVSGRKASYLHDLARKYNNGILSDESIINMDDKSLFTMLTMVNGIGSWSVHMFMIFSLHRPDVLPVNDLGIRKGVQLLYGLEELPRPSQMEHMCDKWRPYRSVASRYLWRFVEAKGTPSSAVAVAAGAMSLEQQHQQQEQQLHHHHHHHHHQPHPHHLQQQEDELHQLQRHRPQQHQHQDQQEQQTQPSTQYIDPINGMINLGVGYWSKQRLTGEEGVEIGGDAVIYGSEGVDGVDGHVGSEDDIVHLPEAEGDEGLLREHVEGGGGDAALGQAGHELLLVDHRPAGHVDQHSLPPESPQHPAVHQVSRLLRQRARHHQHVALRRQLSYLAVVLVRGPPLPPP